ncbi:uncharacterized protein E6C27_scaffold33G00030 [Cucumis melo var. makuwa]|uniref:Transposase-associated domain-containing protein n=1 Tax=Cucumis melo var. makuwa TaxID=1194695 RepID=A0A5A7UAA6_CUCMM|nr:uncharacterized protein E6C27_scaffold33G00030 [Cucumis melo var. makuwa]
MKKASAVGKHDNITQITSREGEASTMSCMCLMMDKSLMNIKNKLSIEYRERVFKFLDVAKYHVDEYGWIRCPYNRCMNSNWDSLEGVERHLLTSGMCPSYTEWMYHGEPVNLYRDIKRFDEGISSDHFHEGTSSSIEHEKETTKKAGLEKDMLFNSDVEEERAHQVFYIDDPKNGVDWKVVHMVQNKHIRDILEVDDVEDNTLCRVVVDPIVGKTDLWKEFRGWNYWHFKKFNDPKQARANLPPKLSNQEQSSMNRMLERSSLTITTETPSHFYNENMSLLNSRVI